MRPSRDWAEIDQLLLAKDLSYGEISHFPKKECFGELFKAVYHGIEGIIRQFIIMVEFYENLAAPEAACPVFHLTDDA